MPHANYRARSLLIMGSSTPARDLRREANSVPINDARSNWSSGSRGDDDEVWLREQRSRGVGPVDLHDVGLQASSTLASYK
jgi:hypothetical protein